MISNKMAAAVLVATLPLAVVVASVDNANAATASPAQVTAHVSDPTPAAGHAFTVSGTFTESGKPAAGQVVKIQAQQKDGSWQVLTGAHQRATGQGAYRLEVILDVKGARELRVVGVGAGDQPNARQKFAVTVH